MQHRNLPLSTLYCLTPVFPVFPVCLSVWFQSQLWNNQLSVRLNTDSLLFYWLARPPSLALPPPSVEVKNEGRSLPPSFSLISSLHLCPLFLSSFSSSTSSHIGLRLSTRVEYNNRTDRKRRRRSRQGSRQRVLEEYQKTDLLECFGVFRWRSSVWKSIWWWSSRTGSELMSQHVLSLKTTPVQLWPLAAPPPLLAAHVLHVVRCCCLLHCNELLISAIFILQSKPFVCKSSVADKRFNDQTPAKLMIVP